MGCQTFHTSNPNSKLRPVYISKLDARSDLREYHYYDCFLIYYVIKGYITLQEDTEDIHLGYGDICVIPPAFKHRLKINTPGTALYSCSFHPDFVEHILQNQVGDSGVLSRMFNAGETIKLNSIPTDTQLHLRNLMDFLLYEYESSLKNAELVIQNCLAAIFCVFSELLQSQQRVLETFDKHSIMYSIDYIKTNYHRPLSLNDMTELTHIPKKEFCQRFKKVSGHTFHNYLNQVRIENALKILNQPESEIALHELSALCGYENYITFYRNFIKHTGLSPVEYISLNRK